MKRVKKMTRRFLITVLCFLPISMAVLLLPLCGTGKSAWQETLGIVVGILFWGGIIVGSVSYFLMYKKYRKLLAQEELKSKIPVFLRFFSNPIAIGVDAVLILSLAGTIYCIAAFQANAVLEFISLFLFVTSFYLHFMVNGKILQYIAQRKKRGVKET